MSSGDVNPNEPLVSLTHFIFFFFKYVAVSCNNSNLLPLISPVSNFTLQYMPLPLSDISQAYRSAPERTEQALTKVGIFPPLFLLRVCCINTFTFPSVLSYVCACQYYLIKTNPLRPVWLIDPACSREEQPDTALLSEAGSEAAPRPGHKHRRTGSTYSACRGALPVCTSVCMCVNTPPPLFPR